MNPTIPLQSPPYPLSVWCLSPETVHPARISPNLLTWWHQSHRQNRHKSIMKCIHFHYNKVNSLSYDVTWICFNLRLFVSFITIFPAMSSFSYFIFCFYIACCLFLAVCHFYFQLYVESQSHGTDQSGERRRGGRGGRTNDKSQIDFRC